MVSMVASEFTTVFDRPLNDVGDEANRDVNGLSLAQYTKRYEIEMSKAMLITLVAFSIPAPVDQVHLRVNEVVTRLPTVALWLLLSGNALSALLALVITVCALKSASADVLQVQLRLSSAGLAAQLFSPESAEQSAREDFDLFHQRGVAQEELEDTARVRIRRSPFGGAKFVTLPSNGHDTDDRYQKQGSISDTSVQRLLSRQTV
jgi:hypothetical protein